MYAKPSYCFQFVFSIPDDFIPDIASVVFGSRFVNLLAIIINYGQCPKNVQFNQMCVFVSRTLKYKVMLTKQFAINCQKSTKCIYYYKVFDMCVIFRLFFQFLHNIFYLSRT